MRFFLDTNTCIAFLRGRPESVRDRLQAVRADEVAVPAMVEAELLFGAVRCREAGTELAKVRAFLAPFRVEPFGSDAAEAYAIIRADLERKGQVIGPNDLVTAATVLAARGTLVTRNTREFARVPGLALEDWQAGV